MFPLKKSNGLVVITTIRQLIFKIFFFMRHKNADNTEKFGTKAKWRSDKKETGTQYVPVSFFVYLV